MTVLNYPGIASFDVTTLLKNTNHMIRVAIIENENKTKSLLSSIIDEYCPSLEIVGFAYTVSDGISLLESTKPDLVFLEIELDLETSFQILDRLKYMTFKLIFTTQNKNHTLKAFQYGAVDYLLKPYKPRDVLKSVDRVKRSIYDRAIFNRLDFLIKKSGAQKNVKISIPTSDGVNIISVNDIIRLEADRSYCYIHLSNEEKVMVSKPLKEIESMLPQDMFFRVHATHLIHVEYIDRYVKNDGGHVVMNNGDKVPIARRRKQMFLDLLMN